MPQLPTIISLIQANRGILRHHVADFTAADMLFRPAPTANHAAYQVSHLLFEHNFFLFALDESAKFDLPPKVANLTPADAAVDDPARFESKDDLLSAHDAQTAKLLDVLATMTEATLASPPPPLMQPVAATRAHAAIRVPWHTAMHVGQLQMIRRVLGKPVLF